MVDLTQEELTQLDEAMLGGGLSFSDDNEREFGLRYWKRALLQADLLIELGDAVADRRYVVALSVYALAMDARSETLETGGTPWDPTKHQQAIHETEMEQDGRARLALVALCRDLGVSIYTDATRGIRDEMHRRNALLRRCFDWWGQDDVVTAQVGVDQSDFGVPVDEPGICAWRWPSGSTLGCSTGLTAEPVDSESKERHSVLKTKREGDS